MAAASPSFVLLFGQQYLVRSANDAALSPTSAFTVSVTFDPNVSEAAQSGTIVSKHNPGLAATRGWFISYSNSTLKVTLTVYDSAGNWKALATAASVTIRTNVTFTFSAGTLNAYVNGAASNGTATNSGTVTAANASTEPFAIGVDSTSTTAVNPFKGAVHFVAFWNTVRSGANIATISANGLLGSGTPLGDSDLVAAWQHTTITAQANSDFNTWIDSKSSLTLTNTRISGVRNVKAQGSTGSVLITRQWDYNLSDAALYTTGLSTAYTLTAPYRLWASGLSEPQIATGFSSLRTDFTVIIRFRKVAGTVTPVIFKKYGINLQYSFTSKEMFCIVGDDTSATLQNSRISFGFNRFPIEATDATLVLRYNAIDKDVDLFIGQTPYSAFETSATTNSFETGTGINFCTLCDFTSAAIVPACLSDSQVDTLILGTSVLVQSYTLSPYMTVGAGVDPVVMGNDRNSAALGVISATVDKIPTVMSTAQAIYGLAAYYALAQMFDPATLKDSVVLVDDPSFDDPLPTITSVTLSGGAINATGSAGPTSAYLCRTWWEIELVSGQLQALGASTYPRDLFSQRRTFTDTFNVPSDVNLNARNAVLVVQPQKNAKVTFRSAPYLISATAPTDPGQVVTAATINGSGSVTTTVTYGSTNAGPCTTWYEVETGVGTNTYARVSPLYTSMSFVTGGSLSDTFVLGAATGWTGRRIRYVINPNGASTTFFYGTSRSLVDFVYTSPAPSVTTVTMTAARAITATGSYSASNIGTSTVWWELTVSAGVFEAFCAKTSGVNVSAGGTVSNTFSVPQNFSLTGKVLRLAIQGANAVTYYSSNYTLTETAPTDPAPLVTAAACTLGKLLTASANLGTCTLPNAKMWWEVDYSGTGAFIEVLGTVSSISMVSSSTKNLSYQFPTQLDHAGKSIRLVVQSTDDARYSWTSGTISITQEAAVNPSPVLTAASTTALGNFSSTGSIGASNLGTVTAWVEADVTGTGNFISVLGTNATLALSTTLSTPFNVTITLGSGPNLAGTAARIGVRSNTFPELVYYSSTFTVTTASTSAPTLTISSAVEDQNGQFTVSGTAGPTTIGLCDVWFEIPVGSVGNFLGKMFTQNSINLTSAQGVGGTILLPNRLSLGGQGIVLVATPAGRPDIRYVSSVTTVSETTFTSPTPTLTAASITPTGTFSYTGTTTASNIGAATYWVEIAEDGTFTAIINKQTAPNTAISQIFGGNVALPGKQVLTGTTARLVYQINSRPDQVYYSSNFPVTVQTFTGTPVVSTATYDITSAFSSSVNIPNGNNFGTGTEWWEIQVSAGVFTALISQRAVTHAATAHTSNITVTLPDRFDLSGKSVRYAFSPTGYPETVIYSALQAITVTVIADPGPQIQSYSVDPFGAFAGTVRAGPTNAAFCDVWWEVGMEANFTAVMATVNSVNLFSQQNIAASFNLPLYKQNDVRYDFTGKTIRVAVRTNLRPELVYYSSPVSLANAVPVNPMPVMTGASASDTHVASFAGAAGPTNLGSCTYWYEVDFDTVGVYRFASSGPVDITNLTGLSANIQIPFGLDLSSRFVKLVVSPVGDPLLQYRSAGYQLLGPGWANFSVDVVTPYNVDLQFHQAYRYVVVNHTSDIEVVAWYEAGEFKVNAVNGFEYVVLPTGTTYDNLSRTTQNLIDRGTLGYERRLVTVKGLGETVAPVVVSPPGPTISIIQPVSLWTSTAGASIRYTLDGSEPTIDSPLYQAPFTLSAGITVVRARGFEDGLLPSDVAGAQYTIVAQVVAPTFLPGDRNITEASAVSIQSSTPAATIYYTLDGSTPTVGSIQYTGSFRLTAGTVLLKAFAVAAGLASSNVSTATFVVTGADGAAWAVTNQTTTQSVFTVASTTRSKSMFLRSMTGLAPILDVAAVLTATPSRRAGRTVLGSVAEVPTTVNFAWGSSGTTFVGNWTTSTGNTIAATSITAATNVAIDVTLTVNPAVRTKAISTIYIGGGLYAGQTVTVYASGTSIGSYTIPSGANVSLTLAVSPLIPALPLRIFVASRTGGNVIPSIAFDTAPTFAAG